MVSSIFSFVCKSGFIFCSTQAGKKSSNSDKLNFEGVVHLLIYIGNNENLGLKYYDKIENSPLSDLFIQASIKTEKQLLLFSYSICHDFIDPGRSTGVYIFFLSRWTNLSLHTCSRSIFSIYC